MSRKQVLLKSQQIITVLVFCTPAQSVPKTTNVPKKTHTSTTTSTRAVTFKLYTSDNCYCYDIARLYLSYAYVNATRSEILCRHKNPRVNGMFRTMEQRLRSMYSSVQEHGLNAANKTPVVPHH